jgi:hypothetical protein
MTLETLGWAATAVFTTSYFFRRPAMLRWVQAGAACLWILYGLAIGASPVVVANVIVALAAVTSSFVRRGRANSGEEAAG